MIALLAAYAVRVGVPDRLSRLASWAALVVLAVALLGIAKCTYDRSVIAKHDTAIDAQSDKVEATNAAAAATAATERAADNAAVAETQKGQTDAIHAVPDSAPGAARIALGCQRLRAAGRREADLPSACGSGR